ncbi:hypothetical protein FOCC_FOCC016341 [Frankliniella occidentalis]|nr:hypothetical protein FOCC_FOCC016341 [Frankliniella occidentalis]
MITSAEDTILEAGKDARIRIQIHPFAPTELMHFKPRGVLEGKVLPWEVLLYPNERVINVTNLSPYEVMLPRDTKMGSLVRPKGLRQIEDTAGRIPPLLVNLLQSAETEPATEVDSKVPEETNADSSLNINPNLSEEEKQKLRNLLQKHNDVFVKPGKPLQITNILKVRIPLKDPNKVIYQQNYPIPPALEESTTKLIWDLVNEDVLEPAPHSNYRIPYMIVEKGLDKNNKMQYRLVLSAKKLNECLANINYSPPKVDYVLAALNQKDMFSTIDLVASFHQLEIDEADRHILSIQHKGQTLRYKRLPQGLSISSQYLCYALTLALGEDLYKCALNYVDDTIVYSTGGFEEHIKCLDSVLQRLKVANFGINKAKCKFGYPRISFLGYMVDGNGYKPDPRKFRELEKLLEANNRKKAKSIFHYFSHYRTFIKDFHKISKPILNAADPSKPFEWGPEQKEAVEILHRKLLMDVTLMHFNAELETVLACDGSPVYGVGAVLYQKCPVLKKFRPVAVYSRQFPKSQRNSSAHDAELLALYYSLQRFRMELHAVKEFTIETDCNGLQFLDSLSHPSTRQARVQVYLTQFFGKYKIKYKPGNLQTCPDFHSRNTDEVESYDSREAEQDAWRLPDEEALRPEICEKGTLQSISLHGNGEEVTITDKVLEEKWKKKGHVFAVTRAVAKKLKEEATAKVEKLNLPGVTIPIQKEWREELIAAQDSDKEIQEIKVKVERGEIEGFSIIDGIVYKEIMLDGRKTMVIYVPSSLRKKILENCHDSILGGHYGVHKTLTMIENTYWWPELKSDTKAYVKSCQECGEFKPKLSKDGLLQPIVASRPFQIMGCDFMEMGTSKQGCKWGFVLVDLFSGFVYATPTKRNRCRDAINALKELIGIVMIPEILICDRGPHFTGKDFREFVERMGVKELNIVPPRIHHSNGAAEAAIKRIKDNIKFYCKNNTSEWQTLLPFVLNTVNGSVQSNGRSPYELMYGVKAQAPGHLLMNVECDSEEFEIRRELLRDKAMEKKRRGKEEQKAIFDKNRKNVEYEEGEEVFYGIEPLRKFNYPPKLQRKFRKGKIISKSGPVTYEVKRHDGKGTVTSHVALMKKSYARPRHLR